MAQGRVESRGTRGGLGAQLVSDIVERVRSVCEPERIILFGSAAQGQMTRDSDIDLLVLVREAKDPRSDAVRIRRALMGLHFPFDVVVMRRDRFEETRSVIGGVAWPAAKYGTVIYEAA